MVLAVMAMATIAANASHPVTEDRVPPGAKEEALSYKAPFGEARNASPDIVAADAYAATLFDLKPEEVPSIVAGARRGLGVMDLGRIRLV